MGALTLQWQGILRGLRSVAATSSFVLLSCFLIAPAAAQTTLIKIHTDKSIIPEGDTASIYIQAASGIDDPVTVNLQLLDPDHGGVRLSAASAQLTRTTPKAIVGLSVADNKDKQSNQASFSVTLSSDLSADLDPQVLNFTIPPNDLTATLNDPAMLRTPGDPRTITFTIDKLQADKSFIVSSADSRIMVPGGIITTKENSLSIAVGLAADAAVARNESLPLSLTHLDALRESSAQGAQIGTGSVHSCAIKPDNSLACWGYSQSPPPSGKFKTISSGLLHACGIKSDDTLACWGADLEGTMDPPAGNFMAVSSSYFHNCAIKETDHALACWGADFWRMLSDKPSGEFRKVSTGLYHSCAIRKDDTAACWGYNSYGQSVAPSGRFLDLSSGSHHNCAIKIDNTLTCWGGTNFNNELNAPEGEYLSVTSGYDHNCAIKDDGSIACWGNNDANQLDVPEGMFRVVSAGSAHTCAVRIDGTSACWGYSGSNQLDAPEEELLTVSARASRNCAIKADNGLVCWGDSLDKRYSPPAGSFLSLGVGRYHSCAVKSDNKLACWGGNYYDAFNAPDDSFAAVSAGGNHSCGIKIDGSLACWGRADHGQLDSPSGPFLMLSSGQYHSCALRVDNTLACWGANPITHDNEENDYEKVDFGQVRDVPAGQFIAVSAGYSHNCAIKVDNTLACWGRDLSNSDTSADQNAAIAGQFIAVSAGYSHNCAIKVDNTLACWGNNVFGQHDVPQGKFLTVDASAYSNFSCAVNMNGAVQCWGNGWGTALGGADEAGGDADRPPAGMQARIAPESIYLSEKMEIFPEAVIIKAAP